MFHKSIYTLKNLPLTHRTACHLSGDMIYFPFARAAGSLNISSSFSRPYTPKIILLTSSRLESIRSNALFCVYGLI